MIDVRPARHGRPRTCSGDQSRPSPQDPLQRVTAIFGIPVPVGMPGTGPGMAGGAYVNLFGTWYNTSRRSERLFSDALAIPTVVAGLRVKSEERQSFGSLL